MIANKWLNGTTKVVRDNKHHNEQENSSTLYSAKFNEKILLGFCWGNQGDANLQVGLQKFIIPTALYGGYICNYCNMDF